MTDHAHVLAGAYALDALPDDEHAFFTRHLAACLACRVDVDGYRETAGVLAQAVARPPPTALRIGVLGAAAGTRQDSPPRSGRRGLPDRLRPQLAAVAGVAAAALLSLGGLSVYLHETPQDTAAVAIAPEFLAVAEAVPLNAPAGVEVTFLHAADEGYLVATGLDELSTTEDYQLWLFHDGVPVPAGVFDVRAERTAVRVQAPVRGAELIAVTTEPAGGRSTPSGPVLFSAPL